jgi:hypothetical protein
VSAIQQHPLQRPLVQHGDLPQQARAVAVLQVEQSVEAPVDVVGQVCDLLPEVVRVVAA